jgi:predicted Zn-dependent peptidase
MKNIREEKGLTYGIYSNLSVLRHASMFSVQADVNKNNAKEALSEIYKEIQILREVKVEEEELRIVKNSVTGGYIGSLTTPFEVMEKIKTQVLNDFPQDFYDNFIEKISNVTTDEILATAQKYFSQEKLTVMVG